MGVVSVFCAKGQAPKPINPSITNRSRETGSCWCGAAVRRDPKPISLICEKTELLVLAVSWFCGQAWHRGTADVLNSDHQWTDGFRQLGFDFERILQIQNATGCR